MLTGESRSVNKVEEWLDPAEMRIYERSIGLLYRFIQLSFLARSTADGRAYLQVVRTLSRAMRYSPNSVSQQPSLGQLGLGLYGVSGYYRGVEKG